MLTLTIVVGTIMYLACFSNEVCIPVAERGLSMVIGSFIAIAGLLAFPCLYICYICVEALFDKDDEDSPEDIWELPARLPVKVLPEVAPVEVLPEVAPECPKAAPVEVLPEAAPECPKAAQDETVEDTGLGKGIMNV
jgi:hypothetical protein